MSDPFALVRNHPDFANRPSFTLEEAVQWLSVERATVPAFRTMKLLDEMLIALERELASNSIDDAPIHIVVQASVPLNEIPIRVVLAPRTRTNPDFDASIDDCD